VLGGEHPGYVESTWGYDFGMEDMFRPLLGLSVAVGLWAVCSVCITYFTFLLFSSHFLDPPT